MAYRLSKQADQDIENIATYGMLTFGIRQARKYHDGLARSFEFLSENPLAARERDEFLPAVRIHPSGAHVIIYLIDEAGVLIIRVLGGAQDWAKHL